MRDALSRLLLLLDLVGRVGDWGIGKLYKLRDTVAETIRLNRIIRKAPWLFSWLLCPDLISLSRVFGAGSLLVWNPAISSWHVKMVIIWSGLSDWLDGYIAKQTKKAGIKTWGLERHWPIATGNSVDSAADGITFSLATLYLFLNYPSPATGTLLIAIIMEMIKIPMTWHGYRLIKDYGTAIAPAQIIRKERIGEAKMLCLFVSIILIWAGLNWSNQTLLFLASTLTGIAIGLCYLTTARYIRRFLAEFPDLLPRWYRLPKPMFTWVMLFCFAQMNVSRRYPPPTATINPPH